MTLSDKYSHELKLIDHYLEEVLQKQFELTPSAQLNKLHQAIHYGVFSGGKRFRPLLSVLTAQALNEDPKKVLPVAAAAELVHSYSLIHDDLPCMDNDDERRGQPTNHKKYGEDIALLTGDALLTLAFSILAEGYSARPDLGLQIIGRLSQAAGLNGMIGGQVLDLQALKENAKDKESLEAIHRLKTGALIEFAIQGAAFVCEALEPQQETLREYSQFLGWAFQLADDIEDFDVNRPEGSGYPSLIGLEETNTQLKEMTKKARFCLEGFGKKAQGLRFLLEFNQTRVKS